MKPFIVRLVSFSKGVGKTFIGLKIIELLKRLNVKVCIVKHAVHEIDLQDKDSMKYMSVGVDKVVLINPKKTVIFIRSETEDLEHVVNNYCHDCKFIIVEGYKRSSLGYAIPIINDVDELSRLSEISGQIYAIVTRNVEVMDLVKKMNLKYFNFNQTEQLAYELYSEAFKHIYNQLPKTNCEMCGFSSCEEYVKAVLSGKVRAECIFDVNVKLIVNDRYVYLNPFVKKLLKNLIKAFIVSLKNVPKDVRKVILEISEVNEDRS